MTMLNQLNATTRAYWDPMGVMDQVSTECVLLWWLFQKRDFESEVKVQPKELSPCGKYIIVPIRHTLSNSSSYGADTEIELNEVDAIGGAQYPMRGAVASDGIGLNTKIAQGVSSKGGNQVKVVDVAYDKLDNIVTTIREELADMVMGDQTADTLAFHGVGDLFQYADTSIEYGAISESAEDWWAPGRITDAKIMGKGLLAEIMRTAKVKENAEGQVHLFVTTDELKDGYELTLSSQKQFQNDELADAGFDNVTFRGRPIVSDGRQNAAYVDGYNLSKKWGLCIKLHPDWAFTTPMWEHKLERPDFDVANCRVIGNTIARRRDAHCRAWDVTAP